MPEQQTQGQQLPWQQGGLMPWQVNQTFIGPDGAAYKIYKDDASPSGYTMKRTDANGESFSYGPSPNDPNAQAQWFENSDYGKRLKAAEEAQAANNAWNQNFQTTGQQNQNAYQMGQLGVSQGQLGVNQAAQQATAAYNQGQLGVQQGQLGVNQQAQQSTAQYQQGLLENARQQLEQQKTGQQLQTGYQTLDLGSRLRGSRDYFQYQQMAAGAQGNPLIAGAVNTWANMSQDRPTGGGAWAGGTPEPMTLNALTHDMGASGGQMNAAGNATTDQAGGGAYQTPTIPAFDEFLKNPQKSSANYLATLDDGQLGALQSYSDAKGHDWGTVQSRYNNSRIKQQVGGTKAA